MLKYILVRSTDTEVLNVVISVAHESFIHSVNCTNIYFGDIIKITRLVIPLRYNARTPSSLPEVQPSADDWQGNFQHRGRGRWRR